MSDTDGESVPALRSPALSVSKTVTSTGPYDSVGDVITYSITVTNTGNQTLTGVNGHRRRRRRRARDLHAGDPCDDRARRLGRSVLRPTR